MLDEENQPQTLLLQNGDLQLNSSATESANKDTDSSVSISYNSQPPRTIVAEHTAAHGYVPPSAQDPINDDEDEFSAEALMYRTLLQKIDLLLQRLELDA